MSQVLPIREHVPLDGLTTLRVGGRARWFAQPASLDGIRECHEWCVDNGRPMWVLGGGSNVVVADDGVDGLVVRVGVKGVSSTAVDDALVLDVGAGETWDDIVARVVRDGWAGVECLSGIPGTVGGTPIQNVGAYGQDVSSTIVHVVAYDTHTGAGHSMPAADCGFGYRASRFKGADAGRFVVAGVRFRLTRQAPQVAYPDVRRYLEAHDVREPRVTDVREAVLAVRRGKGMVVDPDDGDSRSVGSFFMNPVLTDADRERIAVAAGAPPPARPTGDGEWRVPAAWLIERSGWRCGDGEGPVGLSTKHPLAIVNRGGARAADIVAFAVRVKRRTEDRFGVLLRPEPVFVGFGENTDLEYLRKAHP